MLEISSQFKFLFWEKSMKTCNLKNINGNEKKEISKLKLLFRPGMGPHKNDFSPPFPTVFLKGDKS